MIFIVLSEKKCNKKEIKMEERLNKNFEVRPGAGGGAAGLGGCLAAMGAHLLEGLGIGEKVAEERG